MKRVFSSNSQVCHVWASESQSEGRAGNVFFVGQTIYSYGYHYPMAKIYTRKLGGKFALVNSYTASVSTSGHRHDVFNALSGRMGTIEVPHPDDINNKSNEIYLENEIAECLSDIFNSRTYGRKSDIETLYSKIFELNKFRVYRDGSRAKDFKLDQATTEIVELLLNEKQVAQDLRQKTKKEEYEARRAETEKQNKIKFDQDKKQIELWPSHLATEHVSYQSWSMLDFDLVRISKGSNSIETSRGAEVPLQDGIKFIEAARAGQLVVGMRIGHFELDKIDGDILTIGCHKISITQAENALKSGAV